MNEDTMELALDAFKHAQVKLLAAKEEMHTAVDRIRALLPMKVGDTLEMKDGIAQVASISWLPSLHPANSPGWRIIGYLHKKDGTPGKRELIEYRDVDGARRFG